MLPPPGSRRSPTRASLGTASLRISSLFVISSVAKLDNPVTLPPGRARLAAKPAPTGSAAFVITMGMVVVAPFAANACGSPVVTIKSTLRRTRSAASSGRRSCFCFGKPVLEGDILSLDPTKLAQLLPERVHEDRAYQKQCYDIQETYAKDFPCLLRVGGKAMSQEHSGKSKTKNSFTHFSLTPFASRLTPIESLCPPAQPRTVVSACRS